MEEMGEETEGQRRAEASNFYRKKTDLQLLVIRKPKYEFIMRAYITE